MLDVLCPLITESDNVSTELLDIILINIVEPNKSSKKNAFHLARELITKTHETIEQYIQQVNNTIATINRYIVTSIPNIHCIALVLHSFLIRCW